MPRKSPKNQAFGGSARQHDAAEFLLYILDVLHDELNFKRNQPDYGAQLRTDLLERYPHLVGAPEKEISEYPDSEPTSHLNTQVAINQEWQRQLSADDSEISRLFHGQSAWITRCSMKDCGFALKRFRHFPVLQLNFPDKYTSRELFAPLSLMELIRWQINLDPRNASIVEDYKCQKCKRDKVCYQERAITYMPDYLIIEFQRFSGYDTEGLGSAKLTAQVKFTESIDLTPAFIPMGDPPPGGINLDRGQIGPFHYDCYAVVMHHGDTLQDGHYTAITRSLDKRGHLSSIWHRFNDTYIDRTTFAECQKPKTTVTHVFMKRMQNA
jgi:ubiquitin carboxyl-terminal hydrolase 8